MRFTKERIVQIITEELEAMQKEGCAHDHGEGKMAIGQLQHIATYATELQSMITPDMELESWVQSKLTLAQDYISKVKHYMDSEQVTPQVPSQPIGITVEET